LQAKVAAPVQKSENTVVGIRHADHVAKVDTNFSDKRRSLGRYSFIISYFLFSLTGVLHSVPYNVREVYV
jgi:hypothetical protein